MNISTAIIMAAGFGSRMLPITKAIRKEMLPLLNRPLIEYIVADCVKAGIKKIVFVINEEDNQIPRYFTDQPALKKYLENHGKAEKYEEIEYLHKMANFEFVRQPDDARQYGTAVPLILAKEKIKKEESFIYLGGDDFLYNNDNTSEVAKIIDYYVKSGADALVTCQAVASELVSKYGVVDYFEQNSYKFMKGIIEKPQPQIVESTLVNVTKWIFNHDVFRVLGKQKVNPMHKEFLITDTACELISQGKKVAVYQSEADYIDFGYPEGWFKGNMLYARSKKETRSWIN